MVKTVKKAAKKAATKPAAKKAAKRTAPARKTASKPAKKTAKNAAKKPARKKADTALTKLERAIYERMVEIDEFAADMGLLGAVEPAPKKTRKKR